MRRMKALMIMVAGAGTVAACGGGSGGGGDTPVTIVTGNIAYFVVRGPANHDTVQAVSGNQVQLAGTALDGNLSPIALIGDTTWQSRDTTVAQVNAHGVVSTINVGSTWVIGSFTPKSSQTAFSDSVLIQVLGQN